MSLWVIILIGTQPPKLETPEVVIYGDRKVEIQVLKRELIPDTIPVYELPILIEPKLEVEKSSLAKKYVGRNSLFSLRGSAGSSGSVHAFYGKDWFSGGISCLNGLRGIKKGLALTSGVNFAQVSFGANYEIKDYRDRGEYKVFRTSCASKFHSLSVSMRGVFGDFCAVRENAVFLSGDYFFLPLQVGFNLRYSDCEGSLSSALLSFEYARYFKGFSIMPGIKVFSESPYVWPSLRLEKAGLIWLAYSCSFSLLTRDAALNYNRFVSSTLHIDKSKQLKLGGRLENLNLNFKWIQDYPYFQKSMLAVYPPIYYQADTNILMVDGTIEHRFGSIGLRYIIDGAPEYIPSLIFAVNIGIRAHKLELNYGWHKYYNYMDFVVSYHPPKSLFPFPYISDVEVFLSADNLFDEPNWIFNVYYEQRRKFLLGLNLKL